MSESTETESRVVVARGWCERGMSKEWVISGQPGLFEDGEDVVEPDRRGATLQMPENG